MTMPRYQRDDRSTPYQKRWDKRKDKLILTPVQGTAAWPPEYLQFTSAAVSEDERMAALTWMHSYLTTGQAADIYWDAVFLGREVDGDPTNARGDNALYAAIGACYYNTVRARAFKLGLATTRDKHPPRHILSRVLQTLEQQGQTQGQEREDDKEGKETPEE